MAKRKQLNLAEVERLGAIIALRRWFVLAGLDPVTMRSRMRRGAPELTAEESTALVSAARASGVDLAIKLN